MHVVSPDFERYPLSASAQYKPPPHTLQQAKEALGALGIQNMVFVQPSIYGNDNSCLLEALRELGTTRGRGVVQFDPKETSDETLQEWNKLGVRGVRINLKSVGREMSEEELRAELTTYAEKIRPLGWSIQMFMPMKMMPDLEKVIPDLNIKTVIDHFGCPDLLGKVTFDFDPYRLLGFESLTRLVQQDTWVKFSAPYRLTKDPSFEGLDQVAKELIRIAPEKIIYASDWPHTRFENIDSVPFISACVEWCKDDPSLVGALFKTNAEVMLDG